MEPRYKEVPKDWQNYFVRYNEVSLYRDTFPYWGKQNRALYRGFRYMEVRYIKVPLYLI